MQTLQHQVATVMNPDNIIGFMVQTLHSILMHRLHALIVLWLSRSHRGLVSFYASET